MAGTVHPILSVLPLRGLVDEKSKVLVENLPPGLPVTLHSLHCSESNKYWQSYGHYVSDNRGIVNVLSDSSYGGTYTGKEPMGLLWSMHNESNQKFNKKNVQTPLVIHISVYRGHVVKGFRENPPMASVVVERWYMAPGVKRIEVKERGITGTLFIPPGPGPFPGLLDIWGLVEKLVEYRASLLASHGFVTMALRYYSPIEIKPEDVDVNFFETAIEIIQEHPLVMEDRVGVIGISFGGSVAIRIASSAKGVNPCCCVSVSGNNLYSSTFPRALEEFRQNNSKYRQGKESVTTSAGPEGKVDMGRIKCPLLYIIGEDDQLMPSAAIAEDIAKMMREAGNDHLLTSLSYPNAGHLIEPSYIPHTRESHFTFSNQPKMISVWGGHPKPHADAQEDSWEKILAFLKQHLYPSPHTVLQAKM